MSANAKTELARRRAALAIAWGCVAAASAYVLQRLYDWSLTGPIDPLLVLRESHVAFYWRSAVATWWGGTLGASAWGVLSSDARMTRAETILGMLAVPWALALVLAAAVYP